MDFSASFAHIDRQVLFIKRRCDLVQYLINEKVSALMLVVSQKESMDADTKEWLDFLTDMKQCMEAANEVKPYLAATRKIQFSQTGIDISILNYLFFTRKNTLIEGLLVELATSVEARSKGLPLTERQSLSVWKAELDRVIRLFKLRINKMRKYEKSK